MLHVLVLILQHRKQEQQKRLESVAKKNQRSWHDISDFMLYNMFWDSSYVTTWVGLPWCFQQGGCIWLFFTCWYLLQCVIFIAETSKRVPRVRVSRQSGSCKVFLSRFKSFVENIFILYKRNVLISSNPQTGRILEIRLFCKLKNLKKKVSQCSLVPVHQPMVKKCVHL